MTEEHKQPETRTVTIRVGQVVIIEGMYWKVINLNPKMGVIALQVMGPDEVELAQAQMKALQNGKPNVEELLKLGDKAIKEAGGLPPIIEVKPEKCHVCNGLGRTKWNEKIEICIVCKGTGEAQNV